MKKLFTITLSFIISCSFSQWTMQNSGITSSLYSVDFLTESLGWVAGVSDVIEMTRDGGQNWEMAPGQLFPSYSTWYSIYFVNENEGYVCGNYTQDWYEAWWKFTTDGCNTWTRPSGSFIPNTSRWTSVFFLNEEIGWRVGYRNGEGKVSKTTTGVGEDWHSGTTVTEPIYDIMFIDENNGWMVGSEGAIYHSTDGGISWTPQNSETTMSLRSVYFINNMMGWSAGYQGDEAIILKTADGGQSWSSTLPPNIKELHSIYFTDANNGWACGSIFSTPNNKGVILYTENGGDTWEEQHVESNCSVLYDIDFANNVVGWAVGSNGVILKADFGEYDIEFFSLADMNYAKYGSGYTFDGNYIYSICGGLDEAPWKSTSIEKYDPAFNTWTEIVNDLIPRRYCSAEFVNSQNKIYIFNGDTYTNTTYTDTVEIVDIMTGDLSYSATNPYPVEYGGSAVWNNKIYIFGGSNSSGYSNRLYEFDPSTESWTRLVDMPEAKQTNGEIINGVLYVIGGYSGSTSKRIDAYDIQNSTWTPLGELPHGISAHATVSSGKNIWLVGSYDNIKFLGQYNVETNSFTQLTSNMIGRKHCGACISEDNLYIFGGNQSSNESSIKNLQYADISNMANAIDDFDVNHKMLSHIYPNPFSTSITIEYELKQPEKVILAIYNHLGQIVFQTQENQPLGRQQIKWNAERFADGIYYYSLQVGDEIANGKTVKVR